MAPAGKSNPSSIHDGALPKKQTNPKRNALWLTRKKAREKIVEDTVNAKRAALGLSAVTLRLPHECSFKGGTRPSYNPPPEEMEKMTEDDLKAWREVERKKRKALKQRENRQKKKDKYQELERMLRDLSRDSNPLDTLCVAGDIVSATKK